MEFPQHTLYQNQNSVSQNQQHRFLFVILIQRFRRALPTRLLQTITSVGVCIVPGIPDEPDLAETFYSQYDDFEDAGADTADAGDAGDAAGEEDDDAIETDDEQELIHNMEHVLAQTDGASKSPSLHFCVCTSSSATRFSVHQFS